MMNRKRYGPILIFLATILLITAILPCAYAVTEEPIAYGVAGLSIIVRKEASSESEQVYVIKEDEIFPIYELGEEWTKVPGGYVRTEFTYTLDNYPFVGSLTVNDVYNRYTLPELMPNYMGQVNNETECFGLTINKKQTVKGEIGIYTVVDRFAYIVIDYEFYAIELSKVDIMVPMHVDTDFIMQ